LGGVVDLALAFAPPLKYPNIWTLRWEATMSPSPRPFAFVFAVVSVVFEESF
jgi:hypothetical protein